jgi:phosphatidylserine/phosphatidylglycerophosphate/cardiolipin synthase-like enzyme
MRKRVVQDGVTINAIAGTNVVTLGLNLTEAARQNCLGFAIQREDHTEDEKYWMTGTKAFAATNPGLGGQVSSRQHPFQTFQWADYSAKPDHDYTYTAIPLSGTPDHLVEGPHASARLMTESELGGAHSTFFNRGAAASQEYARRFLNKDPDEFGDDAFRWLSRGLFEAFTRFLARANGPAFGLFAAIYEFQWPAALQAFKTAAATGADVHVVYDGIPGGPVTKNEAAIAAAGIGSFCRARTTGKIMHNKFVVLTKHGSPISVWTGSTNLTEVGIYGHSNCGHIVEDATVAQAYLDYWNELKDSPASDTEKAWMKTHNPNPADPPAESLFEVFSPRTGLKVLDWQASIAARAKNPGQALFMSFAFGMDERFQHVYEQPDGVLRFALMEKEGNGAGLAQGKIDIARIRRLPNVVVAIGHYIETNSFDRWLAERRKLTSEQQVLWVHTKYMLVDPLGGDPIVLTGSANFSEASVNTNNENVVFVRGDTRVADIYLGEFMRVYSHHAFREAVFIAKTNNEQNFRPQDLVPDATWQKDYFTPGHQRLLRRRYFAGA